MSNQQQTVVGLFRTAADAHLAAKRLSDAGFSREHVDVSSRAANAAHNLSGHAAQAAAPDRDPSDYQNSSGTMTEGAADAVGRGGDSIGNFFSSLFGGADSADTQRYAQVARQPGVSVVTVHCHSDENARRAAELMDEAGAIDVEEQEQAGQYGQSGSTGANAYSGSTSGSTSGGAHVGTNQEGMSAKVIEENLQIGKRTEQTGGARLRSRIVERPVEEHVRLREEHVVVERNPVNRPATEADFTAFKEGEIEVTETAERAVVQKEARVVEEINLRKEVTERDEVVRDTVRNTEVDVEQLSSEELRRREGANGPGTAAGTSGGSATPNR